MTVFEFLGWALLGAFGVYLVARLIFAAYFTTKRLYEESRKRHG